jgi:hypothetical protein
LKEADAFMKKLTALLLVSLLLLLTGCRNTENLRGDVENKDALRVYIDAGYADDAHMLKIRRT